ncbi:unnamed protein product [Anisakis simplex]|uniref:Xylosyltransferase C-terminal domain-containing protein n=1 Tax=Anisakis simplex TaxID=6269 RepID=A0A3P6SN00_ANISI|nr:unnamed protein product [Anisakis simplex]
MLHAWAETIFSLKSHETAASMGGCEFVDLIELHLYKESDDGDVRTIVDCEVLCGSADEHSTMVIELLVSPKSDIVLLNNDAIVDGYRLVDLKVGTDLELKQEVYRNYASVFSQDDAITAKLSWQRVEDQPTTVSANFSSPFVDAEWTDPLGRLVKASTVPSYDSIYGSQIVTLLANETLTPSIGEWQLNIWAAAVLGGPPVSAGNNHKAKTARTHLASVNFVTFPSDGRDLNKSLIRKYFTVMDACTVNTTAKPDGVLLNSSANCSQTLWSHHSPDPKSEFNFYRFLADKTDR